MIEYLSIALYGTLLKCTLTGAIQLGDQKKNGKHHM